PLSHLMRLKDIEVAEGRRLRDGEFSGCDRGVIEFGASRGPDDDAVISLILAGRAAARPDVGSGDIRSKAYCVRTDLTARLDHPFRFVFPELLIGQIEAAAVLRLDHRQPRIAVAAIAKEPELLLAETEVRKHVLGLREVRGAAAEKGERVAHVA